MPDINITNDNKKTRSMLISHFNSYKELGIQDVFKFLYQSVFGCEHMISSEDSALSRIEEEAREIGLGCNVSPYVEALDGNYSRVHLSCLYSGISARTLARIFQMSARHEENAIYLLEEKLKIALDCVKKGELPFSESEFTSSLELWKKESYPPIRHSSGFRYKYKPSYRVVSNSFIPFLPLFEKLDSLVCQKSEDDSPITVAIEGGSASGKTTLSQMLEEVYDCAIFHMDDFFLRPEQRTEKRLSEVGGNVDRERFLEEILIPLHNKKPIVYRKFDCSESRLSPPISSEAKKLNIIEGAYSMHPELRKYYDLSVFLEISPDIQEKRIMKRNSPHVAKMFFDRWIPLERRFFAELDIKEKCDLVIPSTDKPRFI